MADKLLLNLLKDYIDNEFSKIIYNGEQLNTNRAICFTVSKVATRILVKLGYNCKVQRVTVLVGNEKGRKIFAEQNKRGIFDKEELIKCGGWIIGLGVPPYFHYVVYFPKEDEVMDLTLGQASRPQYGLNCEAYWAKKENIPDAIISVEFIEVDSDNFDPIYYKQKGLFKHIIKKGVKTVRLQTRYDHKRSLEDAWNWSSY